VALASTLFSNPDLLLLDEPTNYLDIEGSIWLENFISKYQNTVLIISHDRGLLNNSLDGILHLFDNKLNYYKGNYDKYEKTRRLKLEMQISMKKKQDAQRTHIQSFIDRFRSKASKAKQAQSRLKQLEKMQPIIGVTESSVSPFKFPSPKEIAPPLIKIENGSVGYDENVVLDNLNISIDHEDRIALLGANGEGKSTFSKLLAGKINLIKGNISKSKKLKVGFFAQHQLEELEIGKTPFEHFLKEFPSESISNIRSKLGAAGIGADISDNPVENLSGGQKARLMMALATIDAPHILILDEPTNHLDIESRESLVHAINDYTGSVIIVSHDVHLVEMVADRLWLVKDGRVSNYESDIEDYRKKLLLSKSKKQNFNF
jgi:ATP-binding cassette subfamily F protein 3